MQQIEIAITGVQKYATRECGDVAEVIERPAGGASIVVVDGQGSGPAARSLAMLVSGKALALLRDGVRDDTVAHATADFLHSHRRGQVSATLDIVSISASGLEVTVTRNNPTPYAVATSCGCNLAGAGSNPIGPLRSPTCVIGRHHLSPGFRLVLCTDGVAAAGGLASSPVHPCHWLAGENGEMNAANLGQRVLSAAIAADAGRPRDDMTVLTLTVRDIDDVGLTRLITMTMAVSGK